MNHGKLFIRGLANLLCMEQKFQDCAPYRMKKFSRVHDMWSVGHPLAPYMMDKYVSILFI
jgi:hypothetical protein